MIDLSHWNITKAFDALEVAALISGSDPMDIAENQKILMPVHRLIMEYYQLALNNYPDFPQDALVSVEMENNKILNKKTSIFNEPKFSRKELARWLSAIGANSVYSFDLKKQNTIPKPASHWPWGNHHTEMLGHLEAAARRYWGGNYDPLDATTAPTNVTVSEWLQTERKVSRTMADSIASMLRADGLPTGPRK
jgi:hypothetical protein